MYLGKNNKSFTKPMNLMKKTKKHSLFPGPLHSYGIFNTL